MTNGERIMSLEILRIRRAELIDESRLIEMQLASIRNLGRRHYGADVIESFVRYVGTMDRTMITDQTYFLAEIEGELVACGGWSRRRPSYAMLEKDGSELPPTCPLIRAVYVHPLFARHGLGRRMMHVVEHDMAEEGVSHVALTATLMGVPLYRSIDYHATGAVTLRFPDGRRFIGVAMEKTLTRRSLLAA